MSGCCAAPSLAAWPASGAATLDGISTVAPASTDWHSRRRWCCFPHQFDDRLFRHAGEIMFAGQGFNVYQVSSAKQQVPELSGTPCWINQ